MELEKIRFQQATVLDLTDDELCRFYTTFALVHYTRFRSENYNVDKALTRLSAEFKNLTNLANIYAADEPNNLAAFKFRMFFQRHHKLLLEVIAKNQQE